MHIQGLELLNKKNDSTNYDEFYEFLITLEQLNYDTIKKDNTDYNLI